MGLSHKYTTIESRLCYVLRSWLRDNTDSDADRCGRYPNDPIGFARDVLGVSPWSLQDPGDPDKPRKGGQREFLALCGKYRLVSCVSGHRVGKSFGVAILILWAYCQGYRVFFTANTEDQVNNVIWKAINILVRRARDVMGITIPGGELIYSSARGGLKHPDGVAEVHGIVARKPEALQGLAGKILIVVDEASGLDEKFYEALRGNMAAEDAKMVLIGNPTSASGTFRESHGKLRWTPENPHGYQTLWIESTDSPNITGKWSEEEEFIDGQWRKRTTKIPNLADETWLAEQVMIYGKDSPQYYVRVVGSFEKIDSLKLIPESLLIIATRRWPDTDPEGRVFIGVDPAGHESSGDNSALCVRRALKVLEVLEDQSLTPEQILAMILDFARLYADPGRKALKPVVTIDAGGPIGRDVYKLVREHWEKKDDIRLFPSYASSDPKRYIRECHKHRDELWYNAREWLKAGGSFAPNRELERQLNVAMLETQKGAKFDQVKVTSKEDMREALGRSPDLADAFTLAVWTPTVILQEDQSSPGQRATANLEKYRELDARYGLGDMDPYAGGMDPFGGGINPFG